MQAHKDYRGGWASKLTTVPQDRFGLLYSISASSSSSSSSIKTATRFRVAVFKLASRVTRMKIGSTFQIALGLYVISNSEQ